jgi:hypothetical protein
MRSLAELVFDIGYRREWFQPIRYDFIRWYSYAYNHPKIKQGLSDKDLPQLAYQSAQDAIHFDPDNSIIEGLRYIEQIRSKLQTILRYLKAAALIIGIIAIGTIQHDIHFAVPSLLVSTAAIISTPPIFYHIINHQINSNIELIRKFNKELVKQDPELWVERDPQKRVAYYLWNKSLTKDQTVSLLTFLMVFRAITPRIYGLVHLFIRNHMEDYIDDGVWTVSKREFSKAYHNGFQLK